MRKFSKTYGQSEQKNEKSTTRKHLKPPRVLQSLPTSENLNLLSKSFLSQFFKSMTVGLDVCQIAIFRHKKMNLFKMLDFQRIHFSRKKPLKGATPFCSTNCENKSFDPDHQVQSQCPIRRFLTVITNFFWGALSQKEDDFS